MAGGDALRLRTAKRISLAGIGNGGGSLERSAAFHYPQHGGVEGGVSAKAKACAPMLPVRQKDLGISDSDIFEYDIQIPKVAEAMRAAIDRYKGDMDLAIAS